MFFALAIIRIAKAIEGLPNSKEIYLLHREFRSLIGFILFFAWLVFSYSFYTALYWSIFVSVVSIFIGSIFFGRYVFCQFCPKHLGVYVFMFSLAISQLAWVISAMPISHWTASALLLIISFAWWDVLKFRAESNLTKKFVFRKIAFLTATAGLVLWSSGVII